MGYMCPVCNGYQTFDVTCPTCHSIMDNSGTVLDFVGPYAPYENDSILFDSEKDRTCLHLYSCSACGHDEQVTIQNDWM